MVPSVESPFVRAVKRAFADALLAEIRRTRLGRDETASAGGVSRSYLQLLLKAERQATLGTLISLAEGIGVRPEDLFAKTMENLTRLRPP
jgi:transcriptional regulator with XRE-family HTH domain